MFSGKFIIDKDACRMCLLPFNVYLMVDTFLCSRLRLPAAMKFLVKQRPTGMEAEEKQSLIEEMEAGSVHL